MPVQICFFTRRPSIDSAPDFTHPDLGHCVLYHLPKLHLLLEQVSSKSLLLQLTILKSSQIRQRCGRYPTVQLMTPLNIFQTPTHQLSPTALASKYFTSVELVRVTAIGVWCFGSVKTDDFMSFSENYFGKR